MDIQIISGTDRPNSNALQVSQYLKKLYREEGVETQIIDLQNFPLRKAAGGKYGLSIPEIDEFRADAIEADGLVIVCPEYNGGYPGILKLFIDYMPFPGALEKKPIAFVGEATGAFGAMRAVEQLQQVLGYRNAHIFPERVFIPRVHKNFDAEQGIKNELQQELLETQVVNFIRFVRNFSEED